MYTLLYRFCGLLQFPNIRTNTLNQIMLLLSHGFPKVLWGEREREKEREREREREDYLPPF